MCLRRCRRKAAVAWVNRWEYLVVKLVRIRRLQRLFHNLGLHLQQLGLSKQFRLKLSREFPKEN